MFDRIDHVGIAVESIDEKMSLYRDAFGLEFAGTEAVESQGVRVAFFEIGESSIELLEPTEPDSPVAQFLDSEGEGIHHLAVGCDDIDRARERAEASGLELLSEGPVRGAEDKLISFVHPKGTGGVLVEFTQRVSSAE